jgi:nitrite reductase/ring-hydroxylating ferredoxin subunit
VSAARRLCAFADLAEGRVTLIDAPDQPLQDAILLVRRGDRVFGFLNCCPHMGFTLDWKPERIALDGGAFLRCVHHAAVFRSTDGVCVAGPCPGESLTPVALEVVDGAVVLAAAPDA